VRMRPGQNGTVQPEGSAVAAATTAGTSTLTVTTTVAPAPTGVASVAGLTGAVTAPGLAVAITPYLTNHYVRAAISTDFSTSNSLWNTISMDDVDDPYSLWTTDTLTVARAGLYSLTAGVEWDANATGVRFLKFLLNGSVMRGRVCMPAASGQPTGACLTRIVRLAVNDTIRLQTWQNSGGSLALKYGTEQQAFIEAAYLRP
jgi:hypothetical protein